MGWEGGWQTSFIMTIINRAEVKGGGSVRIPRNEVKLIMERAGIRPDGDHLQPQMLGGKIHLRRNAGGMIDKRKARKVGREELV